MNTKEVGEIKRRVRRDRSNMIAVYGCYVNDNKEIISEFKQSTGVMPENEADKYFGLFKKVLSGSFGKNLIDITFTTAQVAGAPEHKLLMELRKEQLRNDDRRREFYQKIIESVVLESSYLILLGCDTYDVPFKSKDDTHQADSSEETFTYLLCAVCPVKQSKSKLHYVPESKEFHDGGMIDLAAAPELGFLFPAFDNRSTNIYNALYYTHNQKVSQEAFIQAVFNTLVPMPAAEQKKAFDALLAASLEEECSMEVVQTVYDDLCQRIALHKESKVPEPLVVSKDEMKDALSSCGVSEQHIAKFSVNFDEVFGVNANLHPGNIIDSKRFEVKTPDVAIKVTPERSDLIETRIIGGVKYILICADENVEVNGVNICIDK